MTVTGPAHLVELLDGLSDEELSAEVERRTCVDRICAELDRDERMARLLLDRIRERADAGSVSVRHEVDDAGEPRAVRQGMGPDNRPFHPVLALDRARAERDRARDERDLARRQRDALGRRIERAREALDLRLPAEDPGTAS